MIHFSNVDIELIENFPRDNANGLICKKNEVLDKINDKRIHVCSIHIFVCTYVGMYVCMHACIMLCIMHVCREYHVCRVYDGIMYVGSSRLEYQPGTPYIWSAYGVHMECRIDTP